MSENIIEVKELYKSYGDVKAVNGISFQVKKGELFAYLGLNGAGKSTTINIISQMLIKDSGTVLVNGTDIDKESMKVKSEIGIVFQNSVLDKKLTVYDNLRIKSTLYGLTEKDFKKRIYELGSLLELKPLLMRTLGKLSGGQRRKVDIARALLGNPKLLILDEPTTGLDPQTRKIVWHTLNKLREDTGLTIFLTTHYMEEAAEADHVVIIDGGKIVASDTPNELKNQYASDFIRIYDKNDVIANMITVENLTTVEKEYGVEIKVKKLIDAKKLLLKYPDAFVDFEIVKGRMDDVFINATGKQLIGGEENA